MQRYLSIQSRRDDRNYLEQVRQKFDAKQRGQAQQGPV
jgi:hypothetical protein